MKKLLDAYTGLNDFIPDVKFEALKTGGFRAYIPAISKITEFAITANVNGKTLERNTSTIRNYYFIIDFMENLMIGDLISYKVNIKHSGIKYSKAGLIWNVMELLAAYTPLGEYKDLRDFIPDVKFEALKYGGFRAYIPAVCGITRFEVNGLINNDQEFKGRTETITNNYFVINFNNQLKNEDFVLFHKAIVKNLITSDTVEEEGIWVVTELLDSFSGLNDFVPDVKFEALKSGGFRAYIPALSDISEFSMVGNINGNVFNGKANIANRYYFIINFNKNLIIGDLITYKTFIRHKGLPYSKAGLIWKVTELLDSYSPLGEDGSSQDFIPDVKFEALESGGFRAFIPAVLGITNFEIDGQVNLEPFSGSTNATNNSYFIINFDKTLQLGDFIPYRKKFIKGRTNPRVIEEEGIWIVTELPNYYTPLQKGDYSENFIPDIKFEALESGGFRASIPAVPGITKFEIDGRINLDSFSGSANAANNGHYIINFNKTVSLGDFIFYRKKFIKHRIIQEEEIWVVTDLLDSYSSLKPCEKSKTHSSTLDVKCIGELIMADDFDGPVIDNNKWIIEHRIPTYSSDLFEFNSYENRNETCFIRDGILYLKPVVRTQSEIDGVLNLTVGCTSNDDKQCYYKRNRVFIVPPVKSGRITSKNSFQYGRIEIKAKLPVGDWIVPVIHLQLSAAHLNNTTSPKVLIGFSRGNVHLVCATEDMGGHWLYGGVIHKITGGEYFSLLKKRFNNTPYHKYFHVYTLEWTPEKMSFYIDSQPYGDITGGDYSEFMDMVQESGLSKKEFVISLGVAVGGLFDFPDSCNSGDIPKPWNNAEASYAKSFFDQKDVWSLTWNRDDTALQIDYVRVWAI